MNRRILICDDDDGVLDVTRIVLEEAGYHVETLANCDKIFDKIREIKPDAVFLDLWMPGLGGEAITKNLKSDITLKKIPIIIISASRDTEKIARRAGADDFILKPFDIIELEKKAHKYCRPA